MNDDLAISSCLTRVRQILSEARRQALQTLNMRMLAAYWHVGREIVAEEQRGQERAGYGERIIEKLSEQLSSELGRGFSVSNLKLIRQFYLCYQERVPQISYTASSQLGTAGSPDGDAGAGDTRPASPPRDFSSELSWSHYRVLMRITDPQVRSFYEIECGKARWSVRELERQVASLLYERLARSRDRKAWRFNCRGRETEGRLWGNRESKEG